MGNSWSFLFDEMNMSNQDYWYEDGFSLTGNPGAASSDSISFSSTSYGAAAATDTLTILVVLLKIPFLLTSTLI